MAKYEPKHLSTQPTAVADVEEMVDEINEIDEQELLFEEESEEIEYEEDNDISVGGKIGRLIAKILSFVGVTLVIILAGALAAVYLLSKGPSPSATELFVLSLRETSAAGFVAEIFLSDEEIAEIEKTAKVEIAPDSVNTALIKIEHKQDGEGDADLQEIEFQDVTGPSFYGKMMIIRDPSRVSVGVTNQLGTKGQTLEEMIETNGAIGGVNGGGFYDPSGSGDGGTPDGVVISDGKLLVGADTNADTAVIDSNGILHVGTMTGKQAMELDAKWAVSFGPVLVVNGEKCDGFKGGLNPRTAIGQRADGAILLLVINGRRVDSLGATYEDVADVMLQFGAVNALNLDGGSSTMMIYEGEFMNMSASLVGQRDLPTCILVK